MLIDAFSIIKQVIYSLFNMMSSVILMPGLTLAQLVIGIMAVGFMITALKILFKIGGSDSK